MSVSSEAIQKAQIFHDATQDLLKAAGANTLEEVFNSLNQFAETMSAHGDIVNILFAEISKGFVEGGGIDMLTHLVEVASDPVIVEGFRILGQFVNLIIALATVVVQWGLR